LASAVIDTSMIDGAYREFLASDSAFENGSKALFPLRAAREKAASVWRSQGLPSRREERWKYTDVSGLGKVSWTAAEPSDATSLPLRTAFPNYDGEKCVEVTLLNGRLVPSWSSLQCDGVSVKSAAALATENSTDLPKYSKLIEKSFANSSGEVFRALNSSFSNDVVIIEVEAGAILKFPIVVNSFALTTDSLSEIAVVSPRIFIRLGAGAQAGVVENSFGDGRYLTTTTTEIDLARGARLTHARINRESSESTRIGSVSIDQARDSFCETFQFTLGGRLVRENLAIRLNEPGAEAVLDGLYLASGKNHVDHFTSVEHVAAHTTSAQTYKGILNDESRAVFNGRVHIHRDAQKSNASQMNNNLLLSSKAEIDTKPELEIDADDVKAAHGATIGQIDPEHVFYLQARAIPREQATAMLSRGFAADIAFRISNASIRKSVGVIVDAHLSKGGR
jgi:Fe-S cluster assembly protein SufD